MEYQIYTDKDLEEYIKVLTLTKKPFKSKIDLIFKKRTVKQNAYLHKLFTIYGDKIGMTMDEVKDDMSKKFLLIKEEVIDGVTRHWVKKTSGLNTLEWEIFLEQVRRDALMNHELYLPLPEETFLDEEDELELKLL
jgi:hypothetical protein